MMMEKKDKTISRKRFNESRTLQKEQGEESLIKFNVSRVLRIAPKNSKRRLNLSKMST